MKKRRILISNMKIERLVVGPIETNCYLLHKEKHVLVIDPGEEAHKIIEHIGNDMVDGIVITHHHFDHVGSLEELKEKYSVPVYDFYNLKEGIQTIGHFTFHVLYTPGHKEDLITLIFPHEKVMFVGDFIFKRSIGRTDLEGGNHLDMYSSLEKIKKYDDNYIIYPGHGENTTLGEEKKYNPYF